MAPAAIMLQLRYALALADTGALGDAITHTGNILSSHPESHNARIIHGVLLCRKGEMDIGLDMIATSADASPLYHLMAVETLDGQAKLALDAGRVEDAEHFWRLAAALAPDNPKYNARLGEALLAGGKLEEAVQKFQSVLMVAPESPHTAAFMEEAFKRLNLPEARQRFWETIVEAHPEAQVPRQYLQ